MIGEKDMLIVSVLRSNARETLTRMSNKINIPISTIYDKLKLYEGGLIKKHTALIDFSKLGFNTRANIVLKVDREKRELLKEFLVKNNNVNSLYKINNGFDFMIEGVFKNLKELEDFFEALEIKFKVKTKQVYYIIDDIKRESFLSDPDALKLMDAEAGA